MDRAEDKRGWTYALCSYAEVGPSVTDGTASEIYRFHSNLLSVHSLKYLLLSWKRVNNSQRSDLYT